ncbi:serine hydrolase domain-containing protein [Actinoalloteichus hymeniacidonis]|uniref:Penicillin-binding protein, beta-lactamase class C n=1 Tax=Actinoalloteichus hymeniacidonis TaxID=340345 RepID=A0AAC9N0R8_9PSEU|nr:serine hydrolase domain-containing protein [Actinoalloteichus hymeniacidonis]AOS65387.1 penicillin-binding protein, beta-lactamase class C [Actinoalloteichus hymeniacidonis]MBB5906527.1 CubicO group peptidase (beta-lactamase class C family) [Actinoalloteichus hymeniacidonis]
MTAPTAVNRAGGNNVPDDVDARLARVLQGLVAQRGVHHANIAITSGDGEQRWSAAASRSDDQRLRPETPFFIASITKRFVITLVLQAYERGELDLAAPINDYLSTDVITGIHVLRGIDRTSEITVRHLATHTSGLPDHFEKRRDGPSRYESLAAGRDSAWTFEDTMRVTREQQRPYFEPQDLTAPRQKARYSDTGFQLLIRILETVTDRSFADLLTERILDPLGLRHTWHPRHHPADPATAAPTPLYAKQRRLTLTSLIESSNDLFSTTADLLTFQRALLGGALFQDARTSEVLTERRNRLRNIPILRYGMGTMFFQVSRLVSPTRRPLTLVGHSGATGTWLFHCPELDLHLVGTVDQAKGQAIPFQAMARLLSGWRRSDRGRFL